jgi:hypothetical protein
MTTSTSQVLTTHSSKPSLSNLWWNTNLPSHEQTPTCPSYLTYALAHLKERANLSTRDIDFKRQTWLEVRAHVAANRLDQFTRVPSDLRRYRQYTDKLVREYGSVMRFVLDERLGWRDSRAGEGRFADRGMYSVKHVVTLSVWISRARAMLTVNPKRRLQNPAQRLAIRHRHADRASRRLDQVCHAFRRCDRRSAAGDES